MDDSPAPLPEDPMTRDSEPIHRRQFLIRGASVGTLALSMSRCAQAAPSQFRIVGYLPTYQFPRLNLQAAAKLTDLILFAAAPEQNGHVDLGKVVKAPFEHLYALREKHQTRLLFSVAGYGSSSPFPAAVSTPENRGRFVQSTMKHLKEWKMDGVDLDWEYPRSQAEWDHYLLLLKALKEELASENKSLSVTIAPSRDIPRDLAKHVDSVQLMSYDYSGRHSTLEQAELDIDNHLRKGIPRKKLILGIPFYGRHLTSWKAITYSSLVSRYNPPEDADVVSEIYFNGRTTVRRKTQHAMSMKIGGVMIWEIGQDVQDERSLLRAIAETVSAGG